MGAVLHIAHHLRIGFQEFALDILDRIVGFERADFLAQFGELRLAAQLVKTALELARRSADLADHLADPAHHEGQVLGTHHHQRQNDDDDQLLKTKGRVHGLASGALVLAGGLAILRATLLKGCGGGVRRGFFIVLVAIIAQALAELGDALGQIAHQARNLAPAAKQQHQQNDNDQNAGPMRTHETLSLQTLSDTLNAAGRAGRSVLTSLEDISAGVQSPRQLRLDISVTRAVSPQARRLPENPYGTGRLHPR
ncbi:hypothetical protein OCEANICA350_11138 [Oceanicaulis sp. 350]|nr:hypothetical protein OCEANICA350_11138 [Oceanicaulis sp. 350]